jgi:DNA-binding transcriptional LysR family regulator
MAAIATLPQWIIGYGYSDSGDALRPTNPSDRHLKLRDLRFMMVVAESGSMAKAAQRLAVSQPVVSKTIGDLEQKLGVRLFDRTSRGVEPTMYGRALIRRGITIFDELSETFKEIEFLADPSAGEVRIGGTEPMVAGILAMAVDRLYQKYPRLDIRVTQASSGAALYRELRERNVDFVVGRIRNPGMEEDLNEEILFEEPLCVVAGTQNPWAHRRKIELRDLADESWVLPGPMTAPGALIAQGFQAAGIEVPASVVISESFQMQIALLSMGRFLAIWPRSLFQFSAKRLPIKILPVKLPAPHGPVGLITLKNRTIGPVAELFMDCIRDLSRSLARKT